MCLRATLNKIEVVLYNKNTKQPMNKKKSLERYL